MTEFGAASGRWMSNQIKNILCGCLPARSNLRRRGVLCPAKCAFYAHLIWRMNGIFFSDACDSAQQVWETSGLWQYWIRVAKGAKGLIFYLLEDTQKGSEFQSLLAKCRTSFRNVSHSMASFVRRQASRHCFLIIFQVVSSLWL